MLPLYKAIAFNQVIEKGGRTRPWSVLVETESGVKPYVVKMFTTQLVRDRDSVTNEVLGNILAKEFDLSVPDAALIEMDENFRQTIRNDEALTAYDMADDRLKFGSSLIEGNMLFNQDFTKMQAARMIELDTLFAYDNLIRNRDRNNHKPNLLVKSKSAYLIDHELGFEIDTSTIPDFHQNTWEEGFYRHHIFLKYLRKSRVSTKKGYFNTFDEYLRTLNIRGLDPYFQQLRHYGFSGDRHQLIKDWLSDAKHNSATFVNLLRGFIT